MPNNNIEMISAIAEGLGELLDQVVFVGGTVTELYASDPAATDIRPTIDVDFIVKLLSRESYSEFETQLRARGFKHDMSQDAPICRWTYGSIKVDVMPTSVNILGFTSCWYEYGYNRRIKVNISPSIKVFILPVPIYIATKLEAVKGRATDLRLSHDFEDIIYILDSCENIIDDIKGSEQSVRGYIISELLGYQKRGNFHEAIECALPRNALDRSEIVFEVIDEVVRIK